MEREVAQFAACYELLSTPSLTNTRTSRLTVRQSDRSTYMQLQKQLFGASRHARSPSGLSSTPVWLCVTLFAIRRRRRRRRRSRKKRFRAISGVARQRADINTTSCNWLPDL